MPIPDPSSDATPSESFHEPHEEGTRRNVPRGDSAGSENRILPAPYTPPNPYYNPQKEPLSLLSISSTVFGIVSLFAWAIFAAGGLIFGAVAVALGLMSVRKVKSGTNRAFGIIGFILGLIMVSLIALYYIAKLLNVGSFADDGYSDYGSNATCCV